MIHVDQQPPRKRELVLLAAFFALLALHLGRDDWRDRAAVEEAKEKIELSMAACKRAIDAAERHAAIIAHVLDRGGAITVNGEVQAVCHRWRSS